jgi:cytosine/adenosine deaminase-related metal-dependent hydrolase
MRLNNVYRVGDDKASNISISGSKIIDDQALANDDMQLVFDQAIVFPGIINSHDHSDFNLFPQLGNNTYHNYTEWGNFIHQQYKQEIADILKIPVELRTKWGLYRNLLCGVTTVVNHGDKPMIKDAPITVLDKEQSLHSVHFEKKWRKRLNHPFKKNIPVVIHTGEGTDQLATDEIDQLIRWNLFNRTLIGIHGVAMTPKQAKNFKALVWCPKSNFYLLSKTAPIDKLKSELTVLFGTDSTLTGDWNIWEHIRLAKSTGMLNNTELLQHFTNNPASVWGINAGNIMPGYNADLVVARLKNEQDTMDSLFAVNPADILLVMHEGSIKLFDELLYSQLSDLPKANYSKIAINGAYKYVYGDLPGLMKEIHQYNAEIQFPISYN